MVDAADESLRTRKKEQSRRDIERALLELVLERGYENVTVEDVCRQAGVSKKTFFNYFPSKDAAIRGRFEATPSVDELKALLEADMEANYIDVMVAAVQKDLADELGDPCVRGLRREIMSRYPQLLFRGHKDIAEIQGAIARALREHLLEHPGRRRLPGEELSIELSVATSAVAGIMRVRLVMAVRGVDAPSPRRVRELIARAAG